MIAPHPARPAETPQLSLSTVRANGINLNVASGGEGPPLLLIHGWPHSWEVWSLMARSLRAEHSLIAPDLRGMGGSERTTGGYDARTLSHDLLGLLDALGVDRAEVIALDLGVAPAFLLALEHPERVSAITLMEGLVGPLPGAERFLAGGPPWWFGFHATPELAETVLAGNEAAYIGFFLDHARANGRPIDPEIRSALLAAYTAPGGLRGGMEAYRALPVSGEQIRTAAATRRLTVPTLAVAGGVVGEAVADQLAGVTDDLTRAAIPDCGHVIPLDQPLALLAAFRSWHARTRA